MSTPLYALTPTEEHAHLIAALSQVPSAPPGWVEALRSGNMGELAWYVVLPGANTRTWVPEEALWSVTVHVRSRGGVRTVGVDCSTGTTHVQGKVNLGPEGQRPSTATPLGAMLWALALTRAPDAVRGIRKQDRFVREGEGSTWEGPEDSD